MKSPQKLVCNRHKWEIHGKKCANGMETGKIQQIADKIIFKENDILIFF